jgi:uncharacterized membrane protein YeaQ/YmgE (transglycosylase-associated protein family)
VGIITWAILGLIAGFIAKWIMPRPQPTGIVSTMVVGIVGALIGGFIATTLGASDGITGLNIWSIAVAVGGSVVLLWLFAVLFRG